MQKALRLSLGMCPFLQVSLLNKAMLANKCIAELSDVAFPF